MYDYSMVVQVTKIMGYLLTEIRGRARTEGSYLGDKSDTKLDLFFGGRRGTCRP